MYVAQHEHTTVCQLCKSDRHLHALAVEIGSSAWRAAAALGAFCDLFACAVKCKFAL